MGDMTPDKGVFRRKGSSVWQHRVCVPKELRPLYGGKDSLPARSLKTLDLAEANSLARARLADYEREFKEKRAALNGSSPASEQALRWTPSTKPTPTLNARKPH